jgi:hypothetical protein
MITPKQRSLIGFAALFGIAAIQACGSDASAPDNVSTAGANTGSHAGSSAAGVSGGGASAAGASSAGAPGAGMSSGSAGRSSGAGGAAAGSGGAAGGAGGAAGGAGGANPGSGGRAAGGAGGRSGGAGGSSTGAAFSDVASILGTACAGTMCHGGTAHTNLTNMTGLYMRLITPLPATAPHCRGTTLVVANNAASSYLLQIVQGRAACMNNGATEMIGPMPLACSKTSANPRACLTAAQIKTLTDWVGAGAPQ